MTHGTGAALPSASKDWQAHIGIAAQQRQELVDRVSVKQLVVGANQAHRVHAPTRIAQLGPGLDDFNLTALADHEVKVQPLAQLLPQAQVLVLEADARFAQVVRADHRGVAPGVAAPEPAALEHRHPGQALVARQVQGGGQPMPAATDDHGVVSRRRLGPAPGTRPAPVACKALSEQL